MDKATLTAMAKLFDQTKAKYKDTPIELTLRVGSEEHQIVNTVAPQEVSTTNKETR